ncbi:tRNA (adenosine(37)-N6)-dimethylallyltransferase MiaA [Caulobacter sp. S45]|uniref:tRNA (adenosine(37)-N6)-dimethylallyltransferase MiaA n=1 Tax=Caulobacter sp. S45 TaxID=1641861 RepID=UPI001575D961|nr:tRNA (adenosine(37)-N6)-dimethylallyltransferase MiaA [Caulobacter sp. S45]
MRPSVWLIAGPTASGKSGLALRLAQAMDAEIVNADSMQLYADLSVLTARPSPADLACAPHHLYGVADASEAWSVGRWLRAARDVLDGVASRDRSALIVGGTGLYFQALTSGLADIPGVPAQVRDATSARLEAQGETEFRAALAIGDPQSAARIQAGDRQRLIRAASVLEATGRRLSAWRGRTLPMLAPGDYRSVVLDPPRAALYTRCNLRLQTMLTRGALEEVASLLSRGLPPELPAMKALGVREFGRHLQAGRPLDAALAEGQLQTRRYAKRQSTWFRNQTPDWPRVREVQPEEQWAALLNLQQAASA